MPKAAFFSVFHEKDSVSQICFALAVGLIPLPPRFIIMYLIILKESETSCLRNLFKI